MVKIIFVEYSGIKKEIEISEGVSLMEGAIANNVEGIDADCGGACACATCHVFIDPERYGDAGARTEMEESMLEFAENITENSRLACQIKASKELDGLRVMLPEAQH